MFSFESFRTGWNNFFYSETDPTSLSLFRIVLGFFLFLNGISLIPDFEVWFGLSTNSLVPLHDALRFYTNLRFNIFKWLSPTETSAFVVLILYTISAFLLMIGFKTRIAGIVCFLLLVSMQNRNYVILNSGDTIMRCMLFLLMLSPCHTKFSIDAWIQEKRGKPYPEKISITFIRLMQLQFSLVYFATTLFKLKGYDWVDGTAVYYTSRLVNFQRVALPYVFDFAITNKFITWSALFIEFAMGTLIWVKEWRKWVLIFGLALHLGIEITMSIGFFEWIMVGSFILFLESEELHKLLVPFRNLYILKSKQV